MLSEWVFCLYYGMRFNVASIPHGPFISGQETLAAGKRKQATAKATVQLAKPRFVPLTRCTSVKV
jgi:hypothetical protein